MACFQPYSSPHRLGVRQPTTYVLFPSLVDYRRHSSSSISAHRLRVPSLVDYRRHSSSSFSRPKTSQGCASFFVMRQNECTFFKLLQSFAINILRITNNEAQ